MKLGNSAVPLIAILTCLLLAGCGGSGLPGVTGTVTVDGQPAPEGLRVHFQPDVPNSSSSTGITDEMGRYVMKFNPSTPGVMTGISRVRVDIPRNIGPEGIPFIPPQFKGMKIPSEYGDESTLTFDVKDGSNTFDIDIRTK